MPETTFACPDLTTFLGLAALGLTAVGQLLTSTRAIVECRMPIGFEDPFLQSLRRSGSIPWDGGPTPGPRAGGVEAHAAGGARAARTRPYSVSSGSWRVTSSPIIG